MSNAISDLLNHPVYAEPVDVTSSEDLEAATYIIADITLATNHWCANSDVKG